MNKQYGNTSETFLNSVQINYDAVKQQIQIISSSETITLTTLVFNQPQLALKNGRKAQSQSRVICYYDLMLSVNCSDL